jgi:hypothetical protein
MKLPNTLLVAIFLLQLGGPGQAADVSPNSVLQKIESQGASQVVKDLWSDQKQWTFLLESVGQGTHAWLDVATALRPGTDGAASETLDLAMFKALRPSPMEVLKRLSHHAFDTAAVCRPNLAADSTVPQAKEMIVARIGALSKIESPALQSTRDQCVLSLKAALKDITDR